MFILYFISVILHNLSHGVIITDVSTLFEELETIDFYVHRDDSIIRNRELDEFLKKIKGIAQQGYRDYIITIRTYKLFTKSRLPYCALANHIITWGEELRKILITFFKLYKNDLFTCRYVPHSLLPLENLSILKDQSHDPNIYCVNVLIQLYIFLKNDRNKPFFDKVFSFFVENSDYDFLWDMNIVNNTMINN
ncbi:hypothetical protein TUBRATIS_003340 [Tubulinosema ratisbonensis]|uniref:Uncharacterized protein n=1 Tax=Tubulinosema ratisbonensis TaxID=291195 RepID=A0A437APM0_9MICR|nr:hypothetical protein TUBRATIS_003340 [Tubulinosema ratisbonensis]